MSVPTTDKREKLKQIKAFHQATLDALNISSVPVISKMAFQPSGLMEKHVGFFESEVSKGDDIYLEFGSKDLSPEQVPGFPLRSLLKWRYNPNFREEYPTSDPDPITGHKRYFVPISELILVTKPEPKMLRTITSPEVKTEERESNASELAMTPPDEVDPLTKDMTIRDYAAIHMRKPCSKKEWLNQLITKWNP
jgi:hypothetical protein